MSISCGTRCGQSAHMFMFFAWLVLVRGDESCDSERNSLLQTRNRGHAREVLAYKASAPEPRCWVKFWEHSNYEGESIVFDSEEASLDKFKFVIQKIWEAWDNQASSVELKPGCKVTIYNGKNYSDDEISFTSNTKNFANVTMGSSNWNDVSVSRWSSNWNDKMSSFKLAPLLPCWVKFWEHINYEGKWKIFDSGEASLDKFKMDNQASSVELKPGCRVTIYGGKNYSNDEISFTSNTTDFGSFYGDRMSSFKLAPAPPCWVKFWEHINYKGYSIVFESEEASLDKLKLGSNRWEAWDNQASSVELKPGCKVTMYNGKNYSDDEISFTSNTTNFVNVSMGSSDWNDKMSSFKLSPQPKPEPTPDPSA